MGKLLTITIPVYNTEAYLSRCIESLIVPEYLDRLEILVVIDGSPDNSLDIAQRYERMYPNAIKVIDKENGGHGSVINKGIELASGKYFRVLDSDDWFDTNEFKEYLDLISHQEVDMVLSNYSLEEVYRKKSVKIEYHDVEYNKIYTARTFDHPDLVGLKLISLPTVTYATRVLHLSGLKVFEHCFHEDLQYDYMVYAHVETFVFNDNIVYKYFVGRPEQSISRANAIRNFEQAKRVRLSLAQYYAGYVQGMISHDMRQQWLSWSLLTCVWEMYPTLALLPSKQAVRETQKYTKEIISISRSIFEWLKQNYIYVRLSVSYPYSMIIAAKLRDFWKRKIYRI